MLFSGGIEEGIVVGKVVFSGPDEVDGEEVFFCLYEREVFGDGLRDGFYFLDGVGVDDFGEVFVAFSREEEAVGEGGDDMEGEESLVEEADNVVGFHFRGDAFFFDRKEKERGAYAFDIRSFSCVLLHEGCLLELLLLLMDHDFHFMELLLFLEDGFFLAVAEAPEIDGIFLKGFPDFRKAHPCALEKTDGLEKEDLTIRVVSVAAIRIDSGGRQQAFFIV